MNIPENTLGHCILWPLALGAWGYSVWLMAKAIWWTACT